MKFYESHYEDYIDSIKENNLHPELKTVLDNLPKTIAEFGNMIIYGPTGIGKYSQALNILQKYSASNLKYDKKITTQTEKQDYTYHISDVHYEVDMALLGCNSKILWRDVYMQIVDIITVKNDKSGIIVCKNFHMIHAELLDIFYSYMQQHSASICIRFIIITEHVSFIPNNIIQSCNIINLRRPTRKQYSMVINSRFDYDFINRQNHTTNGNILNAINVNEIVNCKEVKSFAIIKDGKIPKDIFNVICDNVIEEMKNHNKLSFVGFRDAIYDMLIYNLDITECIWYILYYFVQNEKMRDADVSDILDRCYMFLKYYNNNYRPIYHLESILFYFITKIYHYE
uniref:Uncharacterized protein n=1 Tax=viral metagenome TaxID=1070528 RepID=A0A6C0F285_9ZZZZ